MIIAKALDTTPVEVWPSRYSSESTNENKPVE